MRFAVVGVTILSASPAFAGGFFVPEIGARATAMGGAAQSAHSDASALVHNPAGMSALTGTQVQAGGALVFPEINFFRRPTQDPLSGDDLRFSGVRNETKLTAIPYLAATTGNLARDLTVGLGIYAPFGASLAYPESGSQRFVVTGIDLRTIFISPAASYRISENLSVGVSLSYIYSDIKIHQKNALQFVTGDPSLFPDPDPSVEGTTEISGRDAFAVGAKLGVLYTTPRFSVGLSVQAPTTLGFSGDAHIQNPAITALNDEDGNPIQAAGARDDKVKLEIPLPLIVAAGASLAATDWLTISADVAWQRWSTFKNMNIDFEGEFFLLPTPGANLYDVNIENNWSDTVSIRAGAEVSPYETLRVRAGGFYDQSPIDDRHFDLLAPDSDKLGVSGGLAYQFDLGEGTTLDTELSYLHVFFQERNVAPGADGSGTDRTILNKPAPSFFEGVTRASADILYFGLALKM